MFDSGGFIAIDYRHKIIVVAFRGTRNFPAFLRNIQALAAPVLPVPLDLCGTTLGCLVSAFFNGIYSVRRDRVMAAVKMLCLKSLTSKLLRQAIPLEEHFHTSQALILEIKV